MKFQAAMTEDLMTRDNPIWNILLAVGSVVGVLSVLTNPAEYGIPASFMPYLRLVSLIFVAIGGKNSTSKLAHSKEGKAKITKSGK